MRIKRQMWGRTVAPRHAGGRSFLAPPDELVGDLADAAPLIDSLSITMISITDYTKRLWQGSLPDTPPDHEMSR